MFAAGFDVNHAPRPRKGNTAANKMSRLRLCIDLTSFSNWPSDYTITLLHRIQRVNGRTRTPLASSKGGMVGTHESSVPRISAAVYQLPAQTKQVRSPELLRPVSPVELGVDQDRRRSRGLAQV